MRFILKRRDYTTGFQSPAPMLYFAKTMKPAIKQLLFLLAVTLAFSVLFQEIGKYYEVRGNQSALEHGIWIFTDTIGDDSWRPMRLALDHWTESQQQALIYSDLLIGKRVKFQYPPTAILISKFMDANQIGILEFSTVTTYIFLFLMIAGVVSISLHQYRDYGGAPLSLFEKIMLGILLALLLFTFYPVVKAGTLGQIQVWLNALFAVAILCYMTGRETLAGILLGIMASIKPQYALFVLWGLFRGNKRMVIAMIVTGALGLLAGVLEFGVANYADYLRGLGYLSQHGEAYYSNQSFNGLANRFFSVNYPEDFNNLKWRGYYFPPYNRWVFGFTQATSMALIVIALLKGRNPQKEARLVDFLLMGLGATMASPIAWEHHYGVLFPIFVCIWLMLWFGDGNKPDWRKTLFIGCYLISANNIPAFNALAGTYFNFLQSYLLFAACGVFMLLLYIKYKPLRNL